MRVTPLKTRQILPPRDDITGLLAEAAGRLSEHSVLVITSKIVAIHQGRCVKAAAVSSKDELITKEADRYLPRSTQSAAAALHTLKDGRLIRSAGIDKSNADGYYVLLPKDPDSAAAEFRELIRRKAGLEDLGVIISDSSTLPLRRGALSLAIGFAGLNPLNDYRGQSDLFGRPLRASQGNVADALAAAAGVVMGEGAESVPLALISDLPSEYFRLERYRPAERYGSLEVSIEEDIFAPFWLSAPWRKGGEGYTFE